MTEETFTEDPLHFPKDVLVYLVYDGYDIDQIEKKVTTKETWEAFGYIVYDQPLLSIEECKRSGIDLEFSHHVSADEQRIYYTYASLWRKLRSKNLPGLIVRYDNILVNDLPREYYDNYQVWLPTKEIIIDGKRDNRSLSWDLGDDHNNEHIEFMAGFDGALKKVDILFSGTMFVNPKGARKLVKDIIKNHTKGFSIDKRIVGRVRKERESASLKIVVAKSLDEFGSAVTRGANIEDIVYEFNGGNSSFYKWLYYKMLSLPDHPISVPRSWGDVMNIDEKRIFIK